MTHQTTSIPMMRAAIVACLFDLDGVLPAPDMFLAAAARLGVPPSRCAVFEDALAGVEAGRLGELGWVVGVERVGHAEALRRAGADCVVPDLGELLASV